MDPSKKISKGVKNPIWVAVLVVALSIIVVIFASRILYQRTVDLLTQNLRERILTVSITAAANIDSTTLSALHVEDDWRKPEWTRVVNILNKVKYSNKDIVFMYIFRKKASDPTQMEFIVDADSIDPYANSGPDTSKYVDVNRDGIVEPDGPDKLQWPGQDYPEPPPETFEAYNGPLTSKDLYTDAYGTVLTGYAPILDDNGKTVAVLATDIKAADFFTITRQTLQPFLLFIVFLTLIILMLTLIIIYTWKRYAISLETMNYKITSTNDKLNELLKQREALVHLINHKVKGSFTRTKYIFVGILDGTFGETSPEIKKVAEQGLAFDNGGIQTVDLVLNIANLQNGLIKYEMKNIDLKELVLTTIEDEKTTIKAKGLELELEIQEGAYNVLADALWLKESIRNLITNSVMYTHNGKILVHLDKRTGKSNEKDKILLSIKDTGMGISDEDKKNLFTEGGRGKNSAKINIDSTGYGLYSVKMIVDAHKGRVWAESEGPGKGSTFFIELDAA